MGPDPLPLDALPAAAVAAAYDQAAAAVLEAVPTADLRGGPLADLLVLPAALLQARQADLLDRAVARRSLPAVAADPAADPEATAAVLANFGLSAAAGSAAAGDLTVEVGSDRTVTVAAGATFRSGGREFRAAATVVAKAEPALVGAGDRLLRPAGPGAWAFEVPVVAAEAGSGGRLRAGRAASPDAAPADFVRAYAAADFTGGADPEPPGAALLRLAAGVAAARPDGRAGVAAALRREGGAGDGRVFVAGHGDPEQCRGRGGPLGVAAGGRVDWWVRPAALPEAVTAGGLTAAWAAARPGGGVWRTTVPAAAAAGRWRATGGTLGGVAAAVLAVAVEPDPDAGAGPPPDLASGSDAAFSRFQRLVVDLAGPAGTAGDTRPAAVDLFGLGGVAALQDRHGGWDRADPGADLVVRAAVPVLVRGELAVATPAGWPADVGAVRAAVAAAVNGLGFGQPLTPGPVYAAAAAALPPGSRADGLWLAGTLLRPDGADEPLPPGGGLAVPDRPGGVSQRIAQYFLDPADLAVVAG